MNKKIFLAGAVLMLGLGVVGCAGNNESKVLANPDATYAALHAYTLMHLPHPE